MSEEQTKTPENSARQYPSGRFRRPETPDEADVTRPSGVSFPLDVRTRWLTPGKGRDALNEVLSEIQVLEIDHLAFAAAQGEPFHIGALRELGQRPAWDLVSRVPEAPENYRLAKECAEPQEGPRLDLLLALELAVRCALKPFETIADIPPWVQRSRQAHSQLLASLQGLPLFEPVA